MIASKNFEACEAAEPLDEKHMTTTLVVTQVGSVIGLRALVARGYVIPGARAPEGGSGENVSIVGPGPGSGLMGWVGSPWVPSGYIRVSYGSLLVRTLVVRQNRTVE